MQYTFLIVKVMHAKHIFSNRSHGCNAHISEVMADSILIMIVTILKSTYYDVSIL